LRSTRVLPGRPGEGEDETLATVLAGIAEKVDEIDVARARPPRKRRRRRSPPTAAMIRDRGEHDGASALEAPNFD